MYIDCDNYYNVQYIVGKSEHLLGDNKVNSVMLETSTRGRFFVILC